MFLGYKASGNALKHLFKFALIKAASLAKRFSFSNHADPDSKTINLKLSWFWEFVKAFCNALFS
jgi:hypothetical protein